MTSRKTANTPWTLQEILRRCVVNSDGCQVWTGAANSHGYGAVRIGGKTMRPHKVAYQFANHVTVPSTLDVCHTCDNRLCCNPEHLFVGTRKDNMRDCVRKGRVRIPGMRGSSLTQSKLSENDVCAIRAASGLHREIASLYSVDESTISDIKRRRTWKHI